MSGSKRRRPVPRPGGLVPRNVLLGQRRGGSGAVVVGLVLVWLALGFVWQAMHRNETSPSTHAPAGPVEGLAGGDSVVVPGGSVSVGRPVSVVGSGVTAFYVKVDPVFAGLVVPVWSVVDGESVYPAFGLPGNVDGRAQEPVLVGGGVGAEGTVLTGWVSFMCECRGGVFRLSSGSEVLADWQF
jgi:hypothetical protein